MSYKKLANFAAEAYKNKPQEKLFDFTLDTDLSTKESLVYYNENYVIISIRGTANLNDVLVDLKFIVNRLTHTKRYQRQKKQLNEIIKKYKDHEITITGHSLGGALAKAMCKKYPLVSCVVFNAANNLQSPFNDIMNYIDCKRDNPACISNTTSYRSGLDPISILGFLESNYIPTDNVNQHTINNFTDKK